MDAYIDMGDGFLFIYSADHRKSLDLAKENYRRVVTSKIKRHERENATSPIPGMLVAAVRVEEEDRAEEGNKLAEEMNVAFMHCGIAQERSNVDEVFVRIARIARLIEKHQDRVRHPMISLPMTYLTAHDA